MKRAQPIKVSAIILIGNNLLRVVALFPMEVYVRVLQGNDDLGVVLFYPIFSITLLVVRTDLQKFETVPTYAYTNYSLNVKTEYL